MTTIVRSRAICQEKIDDVRIAARESRAGSYVGLRVDSSGTFTRALDRSSRCCAPAQTASR